MAAIGWGSEALCQGRGPVRSSVLLLIDASGSMGDEIGSGSFCYGDRISLDSNSEIKRGQKRNGKL